MKTYGKRRYSSATLDFRQQLPDCFYAVDGALIPTEQEERWTPELNDAGRSKKVSLAPAGNRILDFHPITCGYTN
jgi:hypothetical protein